MQAGKGVQAEACEKLGAGILAPLDRTDTRYMALSDAQRAKRIGWEIDPDSVAELASRSRGVPRLAVRFLDSAKRVASSKGLDSIEPEHVSEMLSIEGFDSLGFDPVEQRYLSLLKEHRGAVRLNVLATNLGLPKQTVEMFERDFIRLGLITKGDKGRALTPKGIEHLANVHA